MKKSTANWKENVEGAQSGVKTKRNRIKNFLQSKIKKNKTKKKRGKNQRPGSNCQLQHIKGMCFAMFKTI